jgi:hypothetical protein
MLYSMFIPWNKGGINSTWNLWVGCLQSENQAVVACPEGFEIVIEVSGVRKSRGTGMGQLLLEMQPFPSPLDPIHSHLEVRKTTTGPFPSTPVLDPPKRLSTVQTPWNCFLGSWGVPLRLCLKLGSRQAFFATALYSMFIPPLFHGINME